MKKVILSLFLVGILDVANTNIARAQTSRPGAIPAQCREIARNLVNYVDGPTGRMIAFQFASNKSRDGNGHFSITDGYLVDFQPRNSPDVAPFFPTRGRGIWQPVPFYVMDSFKESVPGSRSRRSDFPTTRRDGVLLHLSEYGNVTLVLQSWSNTVLTLENQHCYSDSFGYYITGLMKEVNGTSAVSLVLRKIDL